uniref:Variant surface glycoprotein 1125.332 n=1 Tax=Trypanosoma brucei TaxID=5691 RepID=A0A1J0R5S1_9TRYP|nr:variant surface glycoprotein 1125.332 [Trypanosoma brucei]
MIVAQLLTSIFLVQRAHTGGLDNAADFTALCTVYNQYAKKDTIAAKIQTKTASELTEEIQKLNISTATESWFDNKDGNFTTQGKVTDQEGLDAWRKQAKAAVEKPKTGDHIFERLAPGQIRDKTNKAIAELAARAIQLQSDYEEAAQREKTAVADAQAALTYAMFGAGKRAFDKNKYNSGQAHRTNLCGNGNTGDKAAGDALADAFICLCTGQTGNAQNDCHNGLTKRVQNSGDQTDAANQAWKDIPPICTKMSPPTTVTATTIKIATAALLSRIGALNNDATSEHGRFTLGKTEDGNCDGTAGSKQCINYKQQMTSGTDTLTWLQQLYAAQEKLREAKEAAVEADQIGRQISGLSATARSAYLEAQHAINNPIKETNIKPPATKITKEEDCSKHTEQNVCVDPCKWNENATDKTKKCSLDPKKAAEQATQSTGTEDKKEEKCTGKKQGDCEKDSGCKWDGKECKDSSILVNKQFALSVVSAFVALLF